MKLSSGPSKTYSSVLPSSGYFSKCSSGKLGTVKGIPILSKLNVKSKVFDSKKWAKTSRSVEEASEFQTNCSESGSFLNKLESNSQHRSKNEQILALNYQNKKLKTHQNPNRHKAMLGGSKVKKEWHNLEQQLEEVLELIKEEKEIARLRIEQIRQRVQKETPQRADVSQNTCQNDFVLLKSTEEVQVQTISTTSATMSQKGGKETFHKIALLMKDMNIEPCQVFGKGPFELSQNSAQLPNLEEGQVIKLNKLIIKKLVSRITHLQQQ